MYYNILALIFSLILIVVASGIFCNALEHFGQKLGVSLGVTGSIFAAVGTALPETIIPIFAIYTGHGNIINNEIGIGAILGAPLMLSTLSVFIMAISVIKKRGLSGKIKAESTGLQRDLRFFLISYICAFLATIIPTNAYSWFINSIIVVLLVGSYFIYILLTIKSSKHLVLQGHATTTEDKLFLEYLGLKQNSFIIIIQLIVGLMLLIYFAEIFIDAVKAIAQVNKISVFLLSLIIIPIATELPEKINSILWLRKYKDTLALSNITGAMVFQGSLLPVIGILFGNWKLETSLPIFSMVITIVAVSWLYFNSKRGGLKLWHFIVNGALYLINLILLFHG